MPYHLVCLENIFELDVIKIPNKNINDKTPNIQVTVLNEELQNSVTNN